MQFTKKQKVAAALGAGAVAVAGSGVAFAYWTTTGSGSTTAATEAGDHVVTFKNVSAPTGMYPGDSAHGVAFTITNPGPSKQYVGSVSAAVSTITNTAGTVWDATWTATQKAAAVCSPADFTLVQPTVTPGDLAVGDTAYTAAQTGMAISMIDSLSNQDGCKSVTVNLALSANRS